MYRIRVQLIGWRSEIIRKHFQTAIEARAYIDGLKEGSQFGCYTVRDLDDEERREKWCKSY